MDQVHLTDCSRGDAGVDPVAVVQNIRKKENQLMRRFWTYVVGLVIGLPMIGPAEAYTSKTKAAALSVGASGVAELKTLTVGVVQQNTADVTGTLTFAGTSNAFRDSGAALKLTIDTNVPNNRVIIYTDNLSAGAIPQFCENTALGNDGGGLVGTLPTPGCKSTVPMVWGLGVTGIAADPDGNPLHFVGTSTNTDYVFTQNPSGPGATNGVFITDLAHVVTFTTANSTLDNQAMKRCSDNVVVTNTAGDGLYPQFFGGAGIDRDLCDNVSGLKIAAAEELSKNIAVIAHGCSGTTCNVPHLATSNPADQIKVTGPFYVPIVADFRFAPPQNYATNTLTVELVSQ